MPDPTPTPTPVPVTPCRAEIGQCVYIWDSNSIPGRWVYFSNSCISCCKCVAGDGQDLPYEYKNYCDENYGGQSYCYLDCIGNYDGSPCCQTVPCEGFTTCPGGGSGSPGTGGWCGCDCGCCGDNFPCNCYDSFTFHYCQNICCGQCTYSWDGTKWVYKDSNCTNSSNCGCPGYLQDGVLILGDYDDNYCTTAYGPSNDCYINCCDTCITPPPTGTPTPTPTATPTPTPTATPTSTPTPTPVPICTGSCPGWIVNAQNNCVYTPNGNGYVVYASYADCRCGAFGDCGTPFIKNKNDLVIDQNIQTNIKNKNDLAVNQDKNSLVNNQNNSTINKNALNTKNGPGTELKSILSKIGIVATPNCSCNKRAEIMDKNGCDWCEENIDTISNWLEEESKKRNLPYMHIAGKTLIRLAIRKARKKEKYYNSLSLQYDNNVQILSESRNNILTIQQTPTPCLSSQFSWYIRVRYEGCCMQVTSPFYTDNSVTFKAFGPGNVYVDTNYPFPGDENSCGARLKVIITDGVTEYETKTFCVNNNCDTITVSWDLVTSCIPGELNNTNQTFCNCESGEYCCPDGTCIYPGNYCECNEGQYCCPDTGICVNNCMDCCTPVCCLDNDANGNDFTLNPNSTPCSSPLLVKKKDIKTGKQKIYLNKNSILKKINLKKRR